MNLESIYNYSENTMNLFFIILLIISISIILFITPLKNIFVCRYICKIIIYTLIIYTIIINTRESINLKNYSKNNKNNSIKKNILLSFGLSLLLVVFMIIIILY